MTTPDDIELTPDYWWIVLSRALRESDLAMAAEARDRLRELGIEVTFTRLLPDGQAVLP